MARAFPTVRPLLGPIMRPALAACALALPVVGTAQAGDLTVAALHADQGLSGPSLRGAAFSPDGKMLTILRGREDDARTLDLWAYDVATGAARVLVDSRAILPNASDLSEEEKARRERQRIYDGGIVSYAWDRQGARVLIPLGGDLFAYEFAEARSRRLTETDAFETDAKLSPQGRYASFIRDDAVYTLDLSSNTEVRISPTSTDTVRFGVAEFVAQEELDRDTGYWWSPDDRFVAFTEIDEAPVKIVERLEFGASGASTIRQRYPFAGTDNVRIALHVADLNRGQTVKVDLGTDPDIYLADAIWSGDGKSLHILRLSRDQKRLDVLGVDPTTGAARLLFSETSETWVNLLGGYRGLKDGSFLWLSERDGHAHIYHHAADGSVLRQLTSGKSVVGGIACVDEASDALWYSGWDTTPTENHLFRTALSGGTPKRMTSAAGWHSGSFAKGCDSFIHGYSNPNQPPQVSLVGADGARRFWLLENKVNANHPYAPYMDSHVEWTFGQLPGADGTLLDYALLKPANIRRGERLPAVQLVYGGPHVQRVAKRWLDPYAQLLVDRGYVVFMVDNRGASNRGKAFEDVLYRRMGQPEVADQASATRWLAAQSFVDGTRIGVEGWSYGGYMTLMMLGQHPELYAAGNAGAPVSDWRLYDTAYTERYMGDPRKVPEAYDAASVRTYAGGIRDHALLLVHGMADDNVIFQNAIDVMAALQAKGTAFRLMTYPGEKHGFRARTNRIHVDEAGLDFFAERLAPQRRKAQ